MVTRKDKSMNGLKYDDGKPRLDLVALTRKETGEDDD